jgi:hypothetical protein
MAKEHNVVSHLCGFDAYVGPHLSNLPQTHARPRTFTVSNNVLQSFHDTRTRPLMSLSRRSRQGWSEPYDETLENLALFMRKRG